MKNVIIYVFAILSLTNNMYGKVLKVLPFCNILRMNGSPPRWFHVIMDLSRLLRCIGPKTERRCFFNKGDVIKFRYRVLIHGGDTQQANITNLYEQYTKV
jgi:hypothetical protein